MIPKKIIFKKNIRPVNDLDAVKEIATMLELENQIKLYRGKRGTMRTWTK